jgi:hypothetical protein
VGRGGGLLLLNPDAPDGDRVISRVNLFGEEPSEAEDLLTLPAVVGDRLYLRGDKEQVCVKLSAS